MDISQKHFPEGSNDEDVASVDYWIGHLSLEAYVVGAFIIPIPIFPFDLNTNYFV